MDWTTLLTSIGVSLATASWLSKQLITHWFNKEFERYKAARQTELEEYKADRQRDLEISKIDRQQSLEAIKLALQGHIHKEAEVFLGEHAVEQEYKLEARKRLYKAIGPLRFQLLKACRDLSRRIQSHRKWSYLTSLNYYYGRSTMFRILRPLSIAELIERQITYADFAIDSAAIGLLRFKKAVYMAFTSDEIVFNHPHINWNEQVEHIFYDYLNRAANALIIKDDTHIERVMYFHEFDNFIMQEENLKLFEPLPSILEEFEIKSKPVFWLRLVCYGFICNNFINEVGDSIGFEKTDFMLKELLEAASDAHINQNLQKSVKNT